MAKSDILISFQLGRNVGKFLAVESAGSKLLRDAISEMSVAFAQRTTKIRVNLAAKRIKQVVETAYTDAVRYAATRMLGRASPRGIANRSENMEVFIGGQFAAEWRPLSVRQIRKQNAGQGTNHSGKFFQDTGALKRELMSLARAMVKRTGVAKVTIKDHDTGKYRKPLKSTGIVPVADLRITLLPNVYPSQIPGIRSGVVSDENPSMGFEKSLGLSDEAIKKLRGPVIPGQDNLYHRPLLQPVFTYWSLYKIPALIQESLNRNVNINKRGGGVEDYDTGGAGI